MVDNLTHMDPEHEHLWSQSNEPKPSISPLMFPDEIARLTKVFQALEDDAHIVEYGCGGSTLLWASLLLSGQHLYVVEHNEDWYGQINRAISDPNITLMHAPISEMTAYASATEELPIGADAYINPTGIDWRDVRMVFIDGVARAACLAACRHRCQPPCHIFLHDYVGRETWYDWAVHLYPAGRTTHTLLELDLTWTDTE